MARDLPRILVVDDDPTILQLLEEIFREEYEVDTALDGETALRMLETIPYDLLLTDLKLPRISGVEVLREARVLDRELPVIIITAYGDIETAVASIKLGAYDFITKPLHIHSLRELVHRALDQRLATHPTPPPRGEVIRFEGMVSASPRMREVFELIRRVAPSQSTVLIVGESGTGKELVARAIHRQSPRQDHPFIAVSCGALAASILESELFGHVRGAFTGAIRSKIGLFRAADQGTIFLDEIGDTSSSTQTALLRVLERGEIKPVGSEQTLTVNVRVIAATNRDLYQAVEEGSFRQDLYYRLRVVTISLPSLRERSEDIEPLAYHFLEKYSQEIGKRIKDITPATMDLLLHHPWPGNVRELEHTIEHAITICPGVSIHPEHLPSELRAQSDLAVEGEPLWQMERDHILKVLHDCAGDKKKAAHFLGISRSTLYRKLKQYNLL